MNIKHVLAGLLLISFTAAFAQVKSVKLIQDQSSGNRGTQEDWLVKRVTEKAELLRSADGKELTLYNGLLKRVFRIHPNLTCTEFVNLSNGRQLIRSVKEEARLLIDGKAYNVGGLKGQKEHAYLMESWIDQLTAGNTDFKYKNFQVAPISAQLKWDSSRFWTSRKTGGTGIAVTFLFESPVAELAGLLVKVHYELYDGIPLLVKSVDVVNSGGKVYKIDRIVNEVLGMVEEESSVEGSFEKMRKPGGIYFETNYAFNNAMNYANSDQTTHWKVDSAYTSQVHYRFQTPALLEIYPEKAPGVQLAPRQTLKSVRTHELLMNHDDRESRGLAIRKMYGYVAPWTTANPIFMHLVSKNDQEVKTAIDQCAATGYEAMIVSFGSHLNMEDTTAMNLKRWKGLADYAHSKGIRIGGYSLFSSRRISDEDDVVDPSTGKPGGAFFGGHAPCFGSKWGLWYKNNIKNFYSKTGFDIWENDGPYPGDVCASTVHPGHKGLDDSQWRQMEIQKELYHWLNEHGVYVNAPDWYFLDGTNKIALGYREVNFSLPRAQQKILNRQNIYDGTWEKTPAMSWGFVPLVKYQGGGDDATLEPLSAHLQDYEQLMMQYYGAGVQACYRGPRLYDTEETKATVIKVINWYKKYRMILNSDVIHLRRADGRDWDGILHVNPELKEKGLLMLYNPTRTGITRTIKLPLYYSGLNSVAKIREKDGVARNYKLNRDYTVDFTFTLPAEGYSWFVVE